MSTYNSIQADHLLIHSIQLSVKETFNDGQFEQPNKTCKKYEQSQLFFLIYSNFTYRWIKCFGFHFYLFILFFFLIRPIQGQGDRNN